MFDSGIKFKGKVYKVILLSTVFDTPARDLFMKNVYFNTKYGCTFCINEGERRGYVHLFLPDPTVARKSMEVHKDAWAKISEFNFDSFFGITGKSSFFDLSYFDPTKSQVVELMHALGLGIVKRLMEFSKSFQNRNKKSSLTNLKVFDSRLKQFPVNYDFKRSILPASEVKKWKANQCIQYFFFVAPIVMKSMISVQGYQNYFTLVYIISKLWNGGLDDTKLDELRNLMNKFLNQIKIIYDEDEHLINMHLLSHLFDNYKELGPLGEQTTFYSEHLIGQITKNVNSPNLPLEQIANSSSLYLSEKLLIQPDKCSNLKTIGKPFIHDNRTCFKQIQMNGKKFTSFLSKESNNLQNFYIKTNSDCFLKIIYFFYKNNRLFFLGREMTNLNKLFINIDGEKIELDYIFEVKESRNFYELDVIQIKSKLLFVKKFKAKTATFVQDDTGPVSGYIVETNFIKLHN